MGEHSITLDLYSGCLRLSAAIFERLRFLAAILKRLRFSGVMFEYLPFSCAMLDINLDVFLYAEISARVEL